MFRPEIINLDSEIITSDLPTRGIFAKHFNHVIPMAFDMPSQQCEPIRANMLCAYIGVGVSWTTVYFAKDEKETLEIP